MVEASDILEQEISKREIALEIKKIKCENLPKGCLCLVRIGSGVYAYRKWREGGKVLSSYIGKIGKKETTKKMEELVQAKAEFAEIKKEEKELKKLKQAQKALNR